MLQRVAVSLVMLATIIFGLQFLPSAADGADKCPSITVTGVAGDGANALFSANVTSLVESLTYNWSVSSGSIESGQGSLQINVAGAAGQSGAGRARRRCRPAFVRPPSESRGSPGILPGWARA